MPLYIESYDHVTSDSLALLIRSYVSNQKVEVVFIDYLQLLAQMTKRSVGTNVRDFEALVDVVAVLRQLALELEIGIVLASQLTRPDNGVRKVNGIANLELHNLAGGVSTGQNAHIVIALQKSKEAYPDCPFAKDLVYVSILKNRNGPNVFKAGPHVTPDGKAILVFIGAQMKFAELADNVPLTAYPEDE
jgi:replicative DNA helicase